MSVKPPPVPDLPLGALRAMEAAGRLGGFAPAAAELGVTPGAITAHVKALEARLGVALFTRGARGVSLTEAGRRAMPALTQAFDAMDAAKAALRAEAAPLSLSIAALPAVAQLWLRPRIALMDKAFPGVNVSIAAMEGLPVAKRAAFDITVFMGPGGRDALVPVAAPGAEGAPRLTDAAWAGDWARWQDGAPDTWPPGRGTGPVHSLYALAVDDALQGRGVLMARLSLVAELIAAGRLVELGPRVPIAEGIVARPRNAAPATQRAVRWLQARIEGDSVAP